MQERVGGPKQFLPIRTEGTRAKAHRRDGPPRLRALTKPLSSPPLRRFRSPPVPMLPSGLDPMADLCQPVCVPSRPRVPIPSPPVVVWHGYHQIIPVHDNDMGFPDNVYQYY